MVDLRFERLVVKERYFNGSRAAYWLCQCDCGNTVVVRGSNLRRGKTKSCGCLKNELSSKRMFKMNESHGKSNTRLYRIWIDMRKRCNNPHHWAYERYGGRGITFDDTWTDYESFEKWSNDNGYTDTLTLDRIDNDGNYSPDNCRWVSLKGQANNRSNNVKYSYDGKTLTVPEWAEITGIKTTTLYNRLRNYGWSIERALTTPVRRHRTYVKTT